MIKNSTAGQGVDAAARLICSIPRFSHVTPVLYSLHWFNIWNKLPTEIRNEDNFERFNSKLKTFLLRAAYPMKKRDIF